MNRPYTSPCYCTNMRRCANSVSELYDNALRPASITVAQFYILINISRLAPVDTSRLSSHVGLDRSTLVRNLRLLQNNNWVTDFSTEKKHQFGLTETGQQVLERARPLWKNAQEKFTNYMGPEDAEMLLQLLQKAQNIKYEGETNEK